MIKRSEAIYAVGQETGREEKERERKAGKKNYMCIWIINRDSFSFRHANMKVNP